jgi:hypothetical protein
VLGGLNGLRRGRDRGNDAKEESERSHRIILTHNCQHL